MNQSAYRLIRGRQLATLGLCERHLEARKVLGWSARRERGMTASGCADCSRRDPTVLERRCDAGEKTPEPEAPPVDPRQGRLL